MQPSEISEQALLEAVKELIAIPSTADNPEALRNAHDYIRDMIFAYDETITVEEFESNGKPSLLAYRGGTRPDNFHMLLNGHVDVVPANSDDYQAVIRDGKLYGRGAYDMKAAAVVLTQVFCEYVNQVPFPLGLQIVTDEESTGEHGTGYQVAQGVRAEFIICGECGQAPGTYEIANEAKGVAAFEVRFNGDNVHGAYPWRGNNAALKAADFVRRLHDHYPKPNEATSDTTATVTSIISGGTAHNQTPDHALVRVDCRYAPGDLHFISESAVITHIAEIDQDATFTRFLSYGPPLATHADNPLITNLRAAAEAVERMPFSFVRRNGTSDGRFYTRAGGQACEFGIAGEHQHADGEYIALEAFRNYLETMRVFLKKSAVNGFAPANPATDAIDVSAPV